MTRIVSYSVYILSNFARTTFYIGVTNILKQEFGNTETMKVAHLQLNTNVIILFIMKIILT